MESPALNFGLQTREVSKPCLRLSKGYASSLRLERKLLEKAASRSGTNKTICCGLLKKLFEPPASRSETDSDKRLWTFKEALKTTANRSDTDKNKRTRTSKRAVVAGDRQFIGLAGWPKLPRTGHLSELINQSEGQNCSHVRGIRRFIKKEGGQRSRILQ